MGHALDVVVFGLGQLSRQAVHQLRHESPHRVVAITVDAAYRTLDASDGCPVVAFDDLHERYPPSQVAMFVPLSYRHLSRTRALKYAQAKARGYGFISLVSPTAKVAGNAEIGENCWIDTGVIVQPYARIGDNCIAYAGSVISHDVELGRHGFVAAGAVIGGDTRIGEHCVLGLNSTVLNGLRVAPRCFIGAGAVLTSHATEPGVYVGVPARRREGDGAPSE